MSQLWTQVTSKPRNLLSCTGYHCSISGRTRSLGKNKSCEEKGRSVGDRGDRSDGGGTYCLRRRSEIVSTKAVK